MYQGCSGDEISGSSFDNSSLVKYSDFTEGHNIDFEECKLLADEDSPPFRPCVISKIGERSNIPCDNSQGKVFETIERLKKDNRSGIPRLRIPKIGLPSHKCRTSYPSRRHFSGMLPSHTCRLRAIWWLEASGWSTACLCYLRLVAVGLEGMQIWRRVREKKKSLWAWKPWLQILWGGPCVATHFRWPYPLWQTRVWQVGSWWQLTSGCRFVFIRRTSSWPPTHWTSDRA